MAKKKKNTKKKLTRITPKGMLKMHTFLGDMEGCGHIRCIIPSLMLNQLKYKGMRFESTTGMHFVNDMRYYQQMAWIKFQRSVTPDHEKLIQYCTQFKRQTNTGLIYETDDLLNGEIPETNHAHSYYKTFWEHTKNILRMVDGITVSTEPLRDVLKEYNPNIQVIKNRLAPWLWIKQDAEEKISRQNGKPRILWAGSQNHFNVKGNGGDFGKELLDFIKKTTDKYTWVLVGAKPNELKNNNNIEMHDWQSVLNFGHYITNLNCDFGIAPLVPGLFNDCKSNIKMLEYSSMGMPGVYSNCFPYKDAKHACDSEEEMIARIEELALNPLLRLDTYNHDYNVVKDELYWDDDALLEYINKHLKLFKKKLG